MGKLLSCLLVVLSFQAAGSQLVIRLQDKAPITLTHEQIVTEFHAQSFETKLPWLDKSALFTGFKASDLLNYYRIDDAFSVSFVALNDYASSSRVEDLLQYQPIIAYQMNGEKMKVRNKGPYWLVFDLDKYPEIDNAGYHSQMVWQIDEIMIHRRSDGK
ncbi:molybdopterin-dependent oxidoreductase [Vibrio sinaloensis]|uniref:molybdopterin-dependent oxidoreductase n=1 Tax=Photobacterium sp. (strain ATCC 43367) TaxID=379097 RepID=UPI0035E9CB55